MIQQKYEFLNSSSVLEKKILIKNLYLKYWIRRIKSKKFKESYLIDNSFTYTAIKKKSTFLLNKTLGSSLSINDFKFKNKFNKNIKFKMPFSIKEEAESKINVLQKALLIKNFKATFTILVYPKKGGFTAFSHVGMFGFLPNKEYKKIMKGFVNLFNKKLHYKNILNTTTANFEKKNSFYKFALFWFLASFKHIKVQCSKKRFNKNNLKTNVVFLYYKKNNDKPLC